MRRDNLLSTASTLRGIEQAIADFYAGEHKVLKEAALGQWTVHSSTTDRQCPGVRVIRHKGHYRFEMVPA